MELIHDAVTIIAYAYNKSPMAMFVVPSRTLTAVYYCCKSLQDDQIRASMLRQAGSFRFYESPRLYVEANFHPKSKAAKTRCHGCNKKLRLHK